MWHYYKLKMLERGFKKKKAQSYNAYGIMVFLYKDTDWGLLGMCRPEEVLWSEVESFSFNDC